MQGVSCRYVVQDTFGLPPNHEAPDLMFKHKVLSGICGSPDCVVLRTSFSEGFRANAFLEGGSFQSLDVHVVGTVITRLSILSLREQARRHEKESMTDLRLALLQPGTNPSVLGESSSKSICIPQTDFNRSGWAEPEPARSELSPVRKMHLSRRLPHYEDWPI